MWFRTHHQRKSLHATLRIAALELRQIGDKMSPDECACLEAIEKLQESSKKRRVKVEERRMASRPAVARNAHIEESGGFDRRYMVTTDDVLSAPLTPPTPTPDHKI